jgi:hypothetical protein
MHGLCSLDCFIFIRIQISITLTESIDIIIIFYKFDQNKKLFDVGLK